MLHTDYFAVMAFQERTGIRSAVGEHLGALCCLQDLAFNLIKICELERCGIRDGDGNWGGCGGDVIDATISDMMMVWRFGTDRTKWRYGTEEATP